MGTSAIPEPGPSADLEPPPHATPLPDEGAVHHIHQPPKQYRAPTEVGESVESLRGEASRRMRGQMGLTSVHTLEGEMSTEEAHGRPPGP